MTSLHGYKTNMTNAQQSNNIFTLMEIAIHKVLYVLLLHVYIRAALAQSTVDITLRIGSSGEDVVQAVVQRLADSGIFRSDNGILRRISYVESKDGTHPSTYRSGYHGGIWQVDQNKFLDTQNNASYPALTAIYASIYKRFGIRWPTVAWTALQRPLYSGLAARLLLLITPVSIPFGVQAQASYWQRWYDTGNGTAQQFHLDVLSLEANFTSCTRSATVDIVLVLDKSGSIGTPNFQLVRELCVNITKTLQIETSGTRIGVIGFDRDVYSEFNMNQYNTTAAVVSAINAIPYTAGGTLTHLALQRLPTAFLEANGARPFSFGVPKLAVVITDGQSNDPIATQTAARDLHSNYNYITVHAVGVGSGIVYQELQTIASNNNTVNDLSSFSVIEFQNLQSSIAQEACKSLARISTNGTVATSIPENSRKYFSITVSIDGVTLFLTATSGAAKIYASYTISTPGPAYYTWVIFTDKATNVYIPPYVYTDPTPSRKRQATSSTLYLGIQGYQVSNAFMLNTVSGNASSPQPPSGPPTSLIVLGSSSTSISIQWMPPLEYHQNGVIDEYLLHVVHTSTGQAVDILSLELQYTIDGLVPSREYSISVKAHNRDGYGPSSAPVIATTTGAQLQNAGNVAAVIGGTIGGIIGGFTIIAVAVALVIGAVICLKNKSKQQPASAKELETTKNSTEKSMDRNTYATSYKIVVP